MESRRNGQWADLWAALGLLAVAIVAFAPGLRAAYFANDFELFGLPVRAFFGHGLRAGTLRWWATEVGGGYPLFAEGQAGAAYPGNLLFAVGLAPWLALTWTLILHLAWAGLGVYACLRQLEVRRGAAWLGGVVYLLSAPLYYRAVHVNFVEGLAWLPWFAWCLERALRGRRLGYVGAGVALGLQVLAGHPHPPLLCLLWAPPYLLCRAAARVALAARPPVLGNGAEDTGGQAASGTQTRPPSSCPEALAMAAGLAGLGLLVMAWTMLPRYGPVFAVGLLGGLGWMIQHGQRPARRAMWRGLAGLAGAVGLAALLAAVQELPQMELVPLSLRSGPVEAEAGLEPALHPVHLFGLLAPRGQGSPFQAGMAELRRSGDVLGWEHGPYVGILPLFLLLLAPWLGRRPERWLFVATAGAALLLAMGHTLPGYGWLARLPGWSSVRGPARVLGLFAFGAAMTAGLVMDDLTADGVAPAARRWAYPLVLFLAMLVCGAGVVMVKGGGPLLPPHARAWLTVSWLRAGLAAVAAAILVLGRGAVRQRQLGLWLGVAAALVAVDLLAADAGYHPTVPLSADETPVEAILAANRPHGRVWVDAYQQNPLQANRHLLYPGVRNVGVYTPLALQRWSRMTGLARQALQEGRVAGPRWLALWRVAWATRGLLERQPDRPGELAATRAKPFPVAWATPRWRRAATPDEALGLVARDDWRPEAYSIVEQPIERAPTKGTLPEVLWTEAGRHRVTAKVFSDQPHVLVLGRTGYPGWRVRVDGSWSPAERVDYALMGLRLPAGYLRVDLVYEPISIRLGLFLSLVGVALLVAAVRATAWSGRR